MKVALLPLNLTVVAPVKLVRADRDGGADGAAAGAEAADRRGGGERAGGGHRPGRAGETDYRCGTRDRDSQQRDSGSSAAAVKDGAGCPPSAVASPDPPHLPPSIAPVRARGTAQTPRLRSLPPLSSLSPDGPATRSFFVIALI